METKTCTRCGKELPADTEHFYRTTRNKSGLYPHCKQCHAEMTRRWRVEHPEEAKGYGRKAWRESRESREAAKRRWAEKHPDYFLRYREEHKAERKAYNRQWLENNRDKKRAKERNRYALEMGANGSHTAADVLAQYERQKGRCFYCKAQVGSDYHVDHVIPLIGGGSNGPENLVIACPTCNKSKGPKHPMEFCGRLL